MTKPKPKFTPPGRNLTEEEWLDDSTYTPREIQKILKKAPPSLREYLEATLA